ncbi:MAG: glycosyltransferase family 4 protein, partial [Pseudomonadota bacterium]
MRLAFFDPVNWDYVIDTPRLRSLGGSQSGLCYLAEELVKLGHDVTLLNQTQTPRRSRGVNCFNFAPIPRTEYAYFDAIIILNSGSQDLARQIRSGTQGRTRIILWCQHNADQPAVKDLTDPAAHDAWDAFVYVSEWQAEGYRHAFGIKPERTTIIGNAISPAFENLYPRPDTIASQKPWPPVLCYTSTPFRGLDVLLEAFPRIRAAIPGTTLKVYSSMNVYGIPAEQDTYAPLYERCRATEGIEYIGSLPQPALAQELKNATCLAYPNTFAEGYCISVLEAMAAGCIVITSDLGALRTTTAGFGHLLVPPPDKIEHATQFVDLTVRVLNQSRSSPVEHAQRLEKQVRHVAQTGTWAMRAREWHEWLTSFAFRLH